MNCPECGGPMEIDRCCVIAELRYHHPIRGDRMAGAIEHKRLAAAGLCTQCECCIELTREQLRTEQ